MATIESKGPVAKDAVLAAALNLSPAERADLAEQLLRSVEAQEVDAAEVDAAWAEEVERRDRAVDDGTEELLDGDGIVDKLLRGECP